MANSPTDALTALQNAVVAFNNLAAALKLVTSTSSGTAVIRIVNGSSS